MDVVTEKICVVKSEQLEQGNLIIDESPPHGDGSTMPAWHSPCGSPLDVTAKEDKYPKSSSHKNPLLDLSMKRDTKVPARKRSLLHSVLLQEAEKMKPEQDRSQGTNFKIRLKLSSKWMPTSEESKRKRQNAEEHVKVLEEQAFRTNVLASNDIEGPGELRIKLEEEEQHSKATVRRNYNKKRCVQLTKKPFTCKRCLKAYIYLPSLLKHMKIHETAHICPQCKRQFTTVFKLKKHTINAHIIDSVKL